MGDKKIDDKDEADALCKECGHAFKVFIDRVTAGRELNRPPIKMPNVRCAAAGSAESGSEPKKTASLQPPREC